MPVSLIFIAHLLIISLLILVSLVSFARSCNNSGNWRKQNN